MSSTGSLTPARTLQPLSRTKTNATIAPYLARMVAHRLASYPWAPVFTKQWDGSEILRRPDCAVIAGCLFAGHRPTSSKVLGRFDALPLPTRAYRRRSAHCRWQRGSFLSRPPLALMAFALALDIIVRNSTSRPVRRPLLCSALPCSSPHHGLAGKKCLNAVAATSRSRFAWDAYQEDLVIGFEIGRADVIRGQEHDVSRMKDRSIQTI